MALKKLFIFDLDGTLADAYAAIWKSLNFTLKKLGYPPVSFRTAKKNVGTGDKFFMAAFFPDEDVEKALKIYRRHHEKSLKAHTRPEPYAKSTLRLLRKRGKKIAIASNRPRYFTDIIIKKLGFKKYIDYVLCGDEIKSLKPHPRILNAIMDEFNVKRGETVFVGDMNIDMETAKRAKVDAIFIKGGSSPLKDIKRYRNKKVVSSLKEIVCEKGNSPPACFG